MTKFFGKLFLTSASGTVMRKVEPVYSRSGEVDLLDNLKEKNTIYISAEQETKDQQFQMFKLT